MKNKETRKQRGNETEGNIKEVGIIKRGRKMNT
jgi:hypothetical protein